MVALILADGFEEVEAITPIDVLRRGGVEVVTYSITDDLCVCGAHNIMVDADDYIANIDYENVDAVILPRRSLPHYHMTGYGKYGKLQGCQVPSGIYARK